VNVFPVFLLQRVSNHEEQAQEGKNKETERPAELLLRLAHPDHEADQIGNCLVVFGRRHLTRNRQFQACAFRDSRLADLADRRERAACPRSRTPRCSSRSDDSRHGRRTQIGVQPVGTGTRITRFTTGAGDGQIRRRCSEPLFSAHRNGQQQHQAHRSCRR
jgi:hypothetical protein